MARQLSPIRYRRLVGSLWGAFGDFSIVAVFIFGFGLLFEKTLGMIFGEEGVLKKGAGKNEDKCAGLSQKADE